MRSFFLTCSTIKFIRHFIPFIARWRYAFPLERDLFARLQFQVVQQKVETKKRDSELRLKMGKICMSSQHESKSKEFQQEREVYQQDSLKRIRKNCDQLFSFRLSSQSMNYSKSKVFAIKHCLAIKSKAFPKKGLTNFIAVQSFYTIGLTIYQD